MIDKPNRNSNKDIFQFRKYWLYYRDTEIGLTKAEYKTLEQIAHGKKAKECGINLACEQTTVQKHIENIKIKNRIFSTSDLIRMYWDNRL